MAFLRNMALMLGAAPLKPSPDDMTAAARDLLAFKKTPAERTRRKEAIKAEREHDVMSWTWRLRRWASIIVINLLFVLSFQIDLQLVEGSLSASRFLGFHMADLNGALQVMLAHKEILINLVIGVLTVLVLYMIVGGRSFCSWVCPYHLVSEIAEMAHLKLAEKGWVKDHKLHRGVRTLMFGVFSGLAFATGYTVFETINPVGILSRAMTYGTTLALVWIGVLLAVEVFYSRRFWCRYMCPVGLTYGMAGAVAPVRIRYTADKCFHEGKCRQVCLVPHVLDMTKLSYASETTEPLGPDCTRCAMCLDACPTGALTFEIAGLTGGEKRA
jgi:ferredoxin-type protein NapH